MHPTNEVCPVPEPTALTALSNHLADAAESAGARIVTVDARRRMPASGIAWSDGVVVTANHVIERDDRIMVGLPGGETVAATLAGRDPGTDIAVLRVPGATAPGALGGALRVGELVLAVGRPGSDGIEASLGAVAAVGGAWRSRGGVRVSGFVRTDTTFFPGFSGGALVNSGGLIAGMNTSRLGHGGVTLPVSAIEPIVSALLAGGRLKRGYLGISSQPVQLPASVSMDPVQETGLLVVSVDADTPAAAAGVLVGDILVRIDSEVIDGSEALQGALGPDSIGQSRTLKVVRGGVLHEIPAVIGERA